MSHPCPFPDARDLRASLADLEERDHPLSVNEWAELLLLLDHADHAEPPPPPFPGPEGLGPEARMRLMAARIARGYSPFHPADPWRSDCGLTRRGVVLRREMNGSTYAAEVVDE